MAKQVLTRLTAKAITVAVSLAVLNTGHAQQNRDSIVLRRGQTLDNVVVNDETYEVVIYVMGSSSQRQKLSYEAIEEIKHFDEPAHYRRGLGKMNAGDHAEALVSFKKAPEDPKVRKWIHPYCKFYSARALHNAEKYDDAIKTYEELLKQHPNCVFLPQAYENIALCNIGKGGEEGFAAAMVAFKKLIRFGQVWAMQADSGTAQLFEAKKDYASAASKYQGMLEKIRLERDQQKFAPILNLSYKGLGRCLIADGKMQEAEKAFQKLKTYSELAKNVEGLAIAYNGMGDCKKKDGKLEEAALDYLRVNVLYGQKVEEEDARALFSAAQCFSILSRQKDMPEDQAYKRREWSSRAVELYKEVGGTYPTSEYGKAARRMFSSR